MVLRFEPGEQARLSAGTVEEWSRESRQVSRDRTYAAALGGDPCGPVPTERVTLDDATIATLVPVVRLQVERGGARLARLIEQALGEPLRTEPSGRFR